MWKSGWKIKKEWVQGKERWMFLLVCGLFLLLLSVPAGSGERKAREAAASALSDPKEENAGDGALEGVSGLPGSAARKNQDAERLYEQELEERVREILRHVDGVGEVDVMITLRSSKEKVIHVDKDKSRSSTEEKDSAGGTRTALTEDIKESALLSGSAGSGGDPVIEKELLPEIAGIVISAQGGGSAQVKAEISEAMVALFGIPAHKIKVLKRVE